MPSIALPSFESLDQDVSDPSLPVSEQPGMTIFLGYSLGSLRERISQSLSRARQKVRPGWVFPSPSISDKSIGNDLPTLFSLWNLEIVHVDGAGNALLREKLSLKRLLKFKF